MFAPKDAARTQYAIVRRARTMGGGAATSAAVVHWPVASARALANPQLSMRTMLFVDAARAADGNHRGREAIAMGAAWMWLGFTWC